MDNLELFESRTPRLGSNYGVPETGCIDAAQRGAEAGGLIRVIRSRIVLVQRRVGSKNEHVDTVRAKRAPE